MEPAVVFLFGEMEAELPPEDLGRLTQCLEHRRGQEPAGARRLLETLERTPPDAPLRAALRDDELPELAWAIRACEEAGEPLSAPLSDLRTALDRYFSAYDRGC